MDKQKLYELLRTIPRGKVVTYGTLAEMMGNRALARAVGNALHSNPDGEKYPCYKVVNSKGELSHAYAFGGAEEQKCRLVGDGIVVENGKVDLERYEYRMDQRNKELMHDSISLVEKSQIATKAGDIMTEPEVSLRVAMYYIQNHKTSEDVIVSIDGAHVKIEGKSYFSVDRFLLKNGYFKCGSDDKWQGEYQNANYLPHIVVTSKSGIGDILVNLNDGKSLYIESKKFKKQGGGEYPAMRETIGQLMTGCPDEKIPVVAVPYTEKSAELAGRWLNSSRICKAGIRFALVKDNGDINFVGWENNDT